MRTLSLLVVLIGGGSAAVSVQSQTATDLGRWLACADASVLADDGSRLSAAAQAAGFSCREHSRLRSGHLACTGGTTRVLGAAVREFERAHLADGSTVLSVVLNSGPAPLQARLQRAQAAAEHGAGMQVELDTREDGRAELRCRLAGDRPPHGAIAGTLDFRGQQPLPAMRVCATAVDRQGPPTCVQTGTGQHDYLIEDLPAGDYYLTAFATENNPNRLFGVYSSPMAECAAGTPCERQRLQPVTVLPGDVRSGIDPNTLLPRLPAFLRGH